MTTKQQIPVLAARLVEFQEGFSDLSIRDTQWGIMNGKDAVALCAEAIRVGAAAYRARENTEKKDAEAVAPILGDVISTLIIPATTKEFVVKDNFKVDTSSQAKVKISYLGDNFKEGFWEKTEGPFAGSIIDGRRLYKPSADYSIISKLGGQKIAETSMFEIFFLMERQANGESGTLLNNGFANIFYVRDKTGTLRTVSVDWHGDGWYVNADSVENSNGWNASNRVFSRKAPEDSNSLVTKNLPPLQALETFSDKAGFISNH